MSKFETCIRRNVAACSAWNIIQYHWNRTAGGNSFEMLKETFLTGFIIIRSNGQYSINSGKDRMSDRVYYFLGIISSNTYNKRNPVIYCFNDIGNNCFVEIAGKLGARVIESAGSGMPGRISPRTTPRTIGFYRLTPTNR